MELVTKCVQIYLCENVTEGLMRISLAARKIFIVVHSDVHSDVVHVGNNVLYHIILLISQIK